MANKGSGANKELAATKTFVPLNCSFAISDILVLYELPSPGAKAIFTYFAGTSLAVFFFPG